MKCTQPGCSGNIVDGYCDICGMPPTAGPPPVNRGKSSPPPAGIRQPPPSANSVGAPVSPASYQAPRQPNPVQPTPAAAPQAKSPGLGNLVQGGVVGAIRSINRTIGAASPGRRSPKDPLKCQQPGCFGNIVDGYCDVCGQPAGQTNGSLSSSNNSLTTQFIGETPLGSARSSTQVKRPKAGMRLRPTTRIGAGLTTVPPAPMVDPLKAVKKDPEVPEDRRVCSKCGKPVGRATKTEPATTQGVCESCGQRFDFNPAILPGQLIGNQYEVVGPIAYGGMGWIYLARDRNVNDRWVVLKGILNSGDVEAQAVAAAEKQALAHVEHPLIVEIYNFVSHGGADYIVMEYVPGRSLTDLLKSRKDANGGVNDPLPLDWALAFLIEILPALRHLHELGFIYCDFKPDNIMQVADSLKLIDLGGVRRIDDNDSTIYGTIGFQAPEVATQGTSIASDIYTIGRTLLFLVGDLPGFQKEYATTLPPQSELPTLAGQDSLYRLIAKCCAPEPDDRFQTIDEVRVQMLGVLREVVGRASGRAAYQAYPSQLFEPPITRGDSADWHQLPTLRPDPEDPMAEFLAGMSGKRAEDRFALLKNPPQQTPQVQIERAWLMMELGEFRVSQILSAMLVENPWEWRAVWLQGVSDLALGNWQSAAANFNAVYSQVPGEVAPKYALAMVCERNSQIELAEHLYELCAQTDSAYVTGAAFGIARIREQRREISGALEALNLIPPTSSGYSEANRLRTSLLLGQATTLPQLAAAFSSIQAADLPPETLARYNADILTRAVETISVHGADPKVEFGGIPATLKALRPRLEIAYRELAKYAPNTISHNQMIDLANAQRRWSLL